MNRVRGESGQFIQKSDEPRLVRSIRLTDLTWQTIGRAASRQEMTRADLLEQLVEDGFFSTDTFERRLEQNHLEEIVNEILEDPTVTRNGKDKGAAKRALQALLNRLSN
jgi:macrodomain Ter protein organizer (MatP/YcbG family)